MSTEGASKAPLICIMGPTAAGKTDLAVALAEALRGELISVDSALVYRGFDIGAAKPDYPHHLVAIRDPADPYSAAEFVRDARETVAAIRGRGRQPILVGGSMLYYRALLMGLDDIPVSEPAVRAAVEQQAAELGWPALHAELSKVDPRAAARIHPNHSQRIGRALEVWRQTGRPISEWQQTTPGHEGVPHVPLIICPADRAVLHQRIKSRFAAMMEAGLLQEVRELHQRGDLHDALPSVRAVGYRQLWAYLDGQCDLDAAVQRALAATRQLAKRQLTWLRRWPDSQWLCTDEHGALIEAKPAIDAKRPPEQRSVVDAALLAWRCYSRLPKSV